jgi:hypothetical protein
MGAQRELRASASELCCAGLSALRSGLGGYGGVVCSLERVHARPSKRLLGPFQTLHHLLAANYRKRLQVDSIGLSYQKHVDKAALAPTKSTWPPYQKHVDKLTRPQRGSTCGPRPAAGLPSRSNHPPPARTLLPGTAHEPGRELPGSPP